MTSLSTSGLVLPEAAMRSTLIAGEQRFDLNNAAGTSDIFEGRAVAAAFLDLTIITCASAIASFLQSKESPMEGTFCSSHRFVAGSFVDTHPSSMPSLWNGTKSLHLCQMVQ